MRVVSARQPEAIADVLAAIRTATQRGAPAMLITLASHIAKRGAPWPRRVVFPKGDVLKAWGMPDRRLPLSADAIGTIVSAVRSELIARAEARRHYARAVIDRGLADLLVPIGERSASKAKIAWPRGSEIEIPAGATLRLFLHWEEPLNTRVDLDLSIALYDANWRHVGTCDFTHLRFGEHAAVHSGDLTSAPPPLGSSEFVDLDLAALTKLRARHAVIVVFSFNSISFDRLTYGFAGIMVAPQGDQPFDPRSVAQRFDLSGKSTITVPVTVDLERRRMRWLDVHLTGEGFHHQVGGYRAALAHLGKDFADFTETGARPTLWDVAAIHAAARGNVVYVRERDDEITMYKRRDSETGHARLVRILARDHDGAISVIPAADAPTWFATLRDDLAIPTGSSGFVLDARTTGGEGLTRLAAADLIAELAPKR
ncbi:MAG: TerD family protein [Kofleriaceae bacterium]